MITLNQKQFENAAKLIAASARLSELQRLEGFVPSALISRRKEMLKKQIAKLKGETDRPADEIHIRIEVPTEEKKAVKKEKTFSVNLGKLLSGRFNELEEDDDEELLVNLKGLFPEKRNNVVLGKVVTEL